jgi:hypothetical protein
MLLRLSLVFPDRAPSRMAVALRSGSARRLQRCIDEAASGTHDPTPIVTLAAALNAHDRRTRGHSDRVRALTDLVADELRLSETESERLRWAAFLHDIGKLMVPAKVLNKHGSLTPGEWKTVHRHPERGEVLAAPLSDWLGEWIHGIGEHHEHFDGTGYPRGLEGSEITLAGRIVAVTDAFETMTALRTYNRPMSPARAREELTRCAGKHFDPRVVRSFLSISVGRLRWTIGAAAWLAQLPFLGVPARAGAQLVTSAVGTELTMAPVVGVLAISVAGIATPLSFDVEASASSFEIKGHVPVPISAQADTLVSMGGGLGVGPDESTPAARFIFPETEPIADPAPPDDGDHGGGSGGPDARNRGGGSETLSGSNGNHSGWGNGNQNNNGNHSGWINPKNPHSLLP